MGVDQPSSGKQSLPQFQTNVKTSGGDQAYVSGPGFYTRQGPDIGGALMNLAAGLKRRKEENDDRQRAVEEVRLKTETQLDLTQAYEQYKTSYDGPDEEFATKWSEQVRQYISTKRTGIKDSRLLQEYDKFQMPYAAQHQIKAMEDENQRYTQTFRTGVERAKQGFDDLLAKAPTPASLAFVAESLDKVYAPIHDRLKAAGQESAATTELAAEKQKYAVAMIQYAAKQDPDTASTLLADPEVNKHIQDPDSRLQLEAYIERIKNHQVDGLRQEFKPVFEAYQAALALGKDPAALTSKLQMYMSIKNVVRPEELRQIEIAQEMAAPYAALRQASINMSPSEFENLVDQLRKKAEETADEDLPFRAAFHDRAVSALREDRAEQVRNPISSTAALTGAGDAATARKQYIAARLSAGENIDRINVLDQAEAEKLTNAMHNAVAGNRIGDIVQMWGQMKELLGTADFPADKPIQGDISLMDMALTQLSRTTKDPLSKNVIAALSLLPSGQDPSEDNLLLKAAFVGAAEQASLLKQAMPGSENPTLNAFEAEIASKVPEWKLYFAGSLRRSVRGSDLLEQQRSLLVKAALMNTAKGGYADTPGLLGTPLFGTAGRDNAIKQTVKGFLPFTATNVSGLDIRPLSEDPTLAERLFLTEDEISQIKRPPRVRIKDSQILIPDKYAATVTPDKIKAYVGDLFTLDSFWKQQISLTGVRSEDMGLNTDKLPAGIKQWEPVIQEAADKYKVPAWLVAAVMQHESGGNAKAQGKAQDSGLMQIIPSTFAGLRRQHPEIGADVWDPKTNIMAGAAYLGDLYRVYKGDVMKVLRNYNGGPGAVYRPNEMVQNYVPKVMKHVERFRPAADAKPDPKQQALLDYAKKHVYNALNMDGVTLENTDDFSGVRILIDYQGKKVPIPGRDGKPITVPFDHVHNYRFPTSKRSPLGIKLF